MKKLIFCTLVILLGIESYAQKYEPRTTWPYLYEEFIPGRVLNNKGNTVEYDRLNISLADGSLHYVENGTIMKSLPGTVVGLAIDSTAYINVGGRMMEVLVDTDNGAVVCDKVIDTDAMGKADIGYGKSSIASTQNISATALGSGMDFSINRSIDDVTQRRTEGDPIILKDVRGIVYMGRFVTASRTDVMNIPGIDKDKVKQYIKAEKVKFNRDEDLAKLLEFLYTL